MKINQNISPAEYRRRSKKKNKQAKEKRLRLRKQKQYQQNEFIEAALNKKDGPIKIKVGGG